MAVMPWRQRYWHRPENLLPAHFLEWLLQGMQY